MNYRLKTTEGPWCLTVDIESSDLNVDLKPAMTGAPQQPKKGL